MNWSDLKLVSSPFLTLDQVIGQHLKVFTSGVSKLKDATAKIYVNPKVQPRFFRAFPIPLLLKEKLAKELQHLQDMQIITPVKHSEWAAPIISVVKYDGIICLCGNYKVSVIPFLIPDTYLLPHVGDLLAALSGGKVFSKLDLSHDNLQVSLDGISKKLTTINTTRGLFQYEGLPFGISSAPSLFQRITVTLLSDISHVCVYLDDIFVAGTNKEDHL